MEGILTPDRREDDPLSSSTNAEEQENEQRKGIQEAKAVCRDRNADASCSYTRIDLDDSDADTKIFRTIMRLHRDPLRAQKELEETEHHPRTSERAKLRCVLLSQIRKHCPKKHTHKRDKFSVDSVVDDRRGEGREKRTNFHSKMSR
jgi:hypothetical protein